MCEHVACMYTQTACGTHPFARLWLLVIDDFRVTFFPYISLHEHPKRNESVASVLFDIWKRFEDVWKYTKRHPQL